MPVETTRLPASKAIGVVLEPISPPAVEINTVPAVRRLLELVVVMLQLPETAVNVDKYIELVDVSVPAVILPPIIILPPLTRLTEKTPADPAEDVLMVRVVALVELSLI